MRVVFLHPDLGIGGAERLVVDAAVALDRKGHQVKVVTNHYDEKHCFKETRDLDIKQIKWFPRTIFGHMWALCAYIRLCLAAMYVCFNEDFDVVFCDQVSAALLVFKIYSLFNSNFRTIFYCHFPDMLLTKRESSMKKLYRSVIDRIEEWSTGMADMICVNSEFTASVVRDTFKSLQNHQLRVVHPSLNTKFFDSIKVGSDVDDLISHAEYTFVSLNRFEVKKNVKLAIEAFIELKDLLPEDLYKKCHLTIAGGYDPINAENIRYFGELKKYAEEHLEEAQCRFIRSPSDEVKVALLRSSRAVLYTPDREHFGIVPVEAMYCASPVIAVNTGGPLETIKNNETGFLVNQTAVEFAQCMAKLVENQELYLKMKKKGPERVRKLFSFEAFSARLDRLVKEE
ncbi:hypothetical protein WR25_15757 isoform C [Diploscapter pachys]|uniref:Alpha-1,3/1,6-mannosyltransferase ALG2 n=1 Tax=Diploscapter pachys TaxID=2018661 RepID=A0A2A2J5M3_9BILA|nr:hypothetical protein WR25_15757 isoform C [Diploscapter pachys]